MPLDIDKFAKKHDLTGGEIVEMIREKYPQFSKAQLSMVRNAERYGVTLSPPAVAYLLGKYPQKQKSKPQRAKLTVRVPDEIRKSLETLQALYGFKTMQDLLESIISEKIDRINSTLN